MPTGLIAVARREVRWIWHDRLALFFVVGVPLLCLPVRMPAPSTPQGVMPRSKARAMGTSSRSTSRSIKLHCTCSPTKRVHPRSSAIVLACDTTHAGASLMPT